MVACPYGIHVSLLVFNFISHELNTRRDIPYLRTPMYYPKYILDINS